MRHQTTTVFLRHGTTRGPLSLRRTPTFLRFTVAGADFATLDALDQLDDTPRPGEHLIAAALVDHSWVHFDGVKGGRRCGWTESTATYETWPKQPTQEVMRDTAAWRGWCETHAAEVKRRRAERAAKGEE